MAVRMRLARMGRKKKPFYRIVVTDSRSPRDGRYVECVGTYNSLVDPPHIEIKEDRINYWLDQGVVPTDTVGSLLRQKGLIFKRHMKKCNFDDMRIEEELKKWEVLQLERRRRKEERDQEKKREKKKVVEKVEEKTEAVPSAEEEQPIVAETADLKEGKVEGTDKEKESPDGDQVKGKVDSKEAETISEGDDTPDLKKNEDDDKKDTGKEGQEPGETVAAQAEEVKTEEAHSTKDQDDDKQDSDKESQKTEQPAIPQSEEEAKVEKTDSDQVKKDQKKAQSQKEGKEKKEKDVKSEKGKNKKEEE